MGWFGVGAKERGQEVLRSIRVFFMNLESESRGSRNLLTKTPAVVTEESCPSFAVL
jgi:hypothetical protein